MLVVFTLCWFLGVINISNHTHFLLWLVRMSGEHGAFVAWEEKIISEEKGNRIIYYYLKDTVGGSLLAVVGRERSIRHMTYTISEEFLDYYRCWNAPIAGTRWRARRDVVEWLISLVPRHHQPSPISGMHYSCTILSIQLFILSKCLPQDRRLLWIWSLLLVPLCCIGRVVCK